MNDPITAHAARPAMAARPRVGGWLLVLCLMLVVVGPVISAALMADEVARFAPRLAGARGLQAALLVTLLVMAGSVGFGVHAGLRLWLIRPEAVRTARRALLVGLAADIVVTTIDVLATAALSGGDGLLRQIELGLVPGLVFFTLCFAYLDRSERVRATYGPSR